LCKGKSFHIINFRPNGQKYSSVKFISKLGNYKMSFAYTFCTLVTDHQLYSGFVDSAKTAGFSEDCEFLTVDNTGATQTDAYSGLNSMIEQSRGKILILCHQDILFDFDDRKALEDRLRELEQQDPHWGVCGVAGRPENGRTQVTRITVKFGDDQRVGEFPSQVVCLDECILITKRSSGVRLSRDVSGFHLYGTDICLIAGLLGYKAFVINFHLRHLGAANMGSSYDDAYNDFKRKWSFALRDRYIRTTALPIFLTGRREPLNVRDLRGWIARQAQKYHWRYRGE
jgi:hypothetical protein